MTFPVQPSVTRDPHIKEIEIVLFRTIDPDDPEGPQSIQFRITIDDQLDQPMNHLHGDLLPHLSPGQVQDLINFMDAMWTKAVEEVIG